MRGVSSTIMAWSPLKMKEGVFETWIRILQRKKPPAGGHAKCKMIKTGIFRAWTRVLAKVERTPQSRREEYAICQLSQTTDLAS